LTGHVLAAAAPTALGELLSTALMAHPHLSPRDGVQLERFWSKLETHTRARVHSDKLPWDHNRGWVEDLVRHEVQAAAIRGGTHRSLWRVRQPGRAHALSDLLDGAKVAVLATDGRHALVGAAKGDDPEAAAVEAGRQWAQAHDSLMSLPADIRVLTGGHHTPEAVLRGLSLPRHAPTEATFALLNRLPSPAVSPTLDAAFCAWPPAAALLTSMGLRVSPRVSAHPAALAARATHAAACGQAEPALALAERALATQPATAARTEAINALLQLGEEDRAVRHLQRWRREADHPAAWSRLLGLHAHPVSGQLAPLARRHRDIEVRGALARWLVANGLDRQAAEVLARVRTEDWHMEPVSAPS
jgi:hypothetical protein